MRDVVQRARERVFGLAPSTAAKMPETSVLGCLFATGEISRRQYEAGARYADIVREHDLLLGQRSFPKAGNLDRGGGTAGEESAAQRAHYRSAMAKYDRCRAALRDASREDRMAASAVDVVAVDDWYLPNLTPSLRTGLNHLAKAVDIPVEAIDEKPELRQQRK